MGMTVGKMPVLQAVIKVYCLHEYLLYEYLAEMSSVRMTVRNISILQTVIKVYFLHLGSLDECNCRDTKFGNDRSLDVNLTIMGFKQIFSFLFHPIQRKKRQ